MLLLAAEYKLLEDIEGRCDKLSIFEYLRGLSTMEQIAPDVVDEFDDLFNLLSIRDRESSVSAVNAPGLLLEYRDVCRIGPRCCHEISVPLAVWALSKKVAYKIHTAAVFVAVGAKVHRVECDP